MMNVLIKKKSKVQKQSSFKKSMLPFIQKEKENSILMP